MTRVYTVLIDDKQANGVHTVDSGVWSLYGLGGYLFIRAIKEHIE